MRIVTKSKRSLLCKWISQSFLTEPCYFFLRDCLHLLHWLESDPFAAMLPQSVGWQGISEVSPEGTSECTVQAETLHRILTRSSQENRYFHPDMVLGNLLQVPGLRKGFQRSLPALTYEQIRSKTKQTKNGESIIRKSQKFHLLWLAKQRKRGCDYYPQLQ